MLIDAEGDVHNLARSLAQHATRSVEAVDLILSGMVDRIERGALRDPTDFRAFLQKRAQAVAQVRNIAVTDENGDWIVDSIVGTHAPVNTADREYFVRHRDLADRDMYLGEMVISRASQEWAIPLSRRWNKPDGSFGGVIAAVLDPAYFQSFYDGLGVGEQGSIALISSAGRLLVRHPFLEKAINSDMAGAPLFRDFLPSARVGSVRTVSVLTGQNVIVGYEQLPNYPFVVWVAKSVPEVLARWHREALVVGGVIATAALLLVALGLHLDRRQRRVLAAEALIRESEARYRLLADNASDVIMVKDLRRGGLRSYVSPSVRMVLGYEPEEFAILPPCDLIHPDDVERVRTLQASISADNPIANSVHRLRHRDGHWLWVEIAFTRMEQDGEPKLLGAIRDVSGRVAAEETIRASQQEYRLLAETTTDVITRLDLDFRRTYVSPTCRTVFGYEPDEMLGKQPSASVHPDDAPAVREAARRLISSEPVQERVTTTYRTRHKLGHWIWIEAGMSLARDAVGRPAAVVCSLRDVTARKQAEAALEESETRYRLLAENVSDLIVLGHVDGRRSYISPTVTPMLGYTVEEAHRITMREWVHPDDLAAVFATTAGLSATSPTASIVYRLRRKDGSYIWAEAAFQWVDAQGEITIITAIRDMSERHAQSEALAAMKEAAEKASQAKSEFLAAMSHEIRTPLNGVIGYADLLVHQGHLAPHQHRQAERIQTAGKALLTIVNDILDFAKIEAGRIELDPQPFAFQALLEDALSIVRENADRKGLSLIVRTDPALPPRLVGDQDRLRQVVLNLLSNAVKFTGAGHITLRLRCENPGARTETCGLRVEVIDTGIGIPEEKLGRLFQRFSQADGSIQRRFGGTGLGLAISKTLVELMGGEIGVESKVGVGSTFWFRVALPRTTSPVFETSTATTSGPRAGRPARILLAEDGDINQDIARAVLEGAGHSVEIVSDGVAAIEAVQAREFDLVLMDVQMAPGMDGLTATQHIRTLDHPASRLPIVAMTANVLPAQVAEFRAAGMDDHIGKPFKREDLLAAVTRWSSASPVGPKAVT